MLERAAERLPRLPGVYGETVNGVMSRWAAGAFGDRTTLDDVVAYRVLREEWDEGVALRSCRTVLEAEVLIERGEHPRRPKGAFVQPGPPLLDPTYEPTHPPEGGRIPDVVRKWGPRSQLRWFQRFRGQLTAMRWSALDDYYCESVEHRGPCCTSCRDERDYGYSTEPHCCCLGIPRSSEDRS